MDVTKVEFCCEKQGQQNYEPAHIHKEQIIGILRKAEGDMPVKVVCARHNVSAATFYEWRSKAGGLEVIEARRLRALEAENRRLKRLVADHSLLLPHGQFVFADLKHEGANHALRLVFVTLAVWMTSQSLRRIIRRRCNGWSCRS